MLGRLTESASRSAWSRLACSTVPRSGPFADDLVFQFRFDGGAPSLDAPHLKVNFFGGGERKVGSLLSQTIAPVQEPQTHALFLGGLGMMGWMARRRRKQA